MVSWHHRYRVPCSAVRVGPLEPRSNYFHPPTFFEVLEVLGVFISVIQSREVQHMTRSHIYDSEDSTRLRRDHSSIIHTFLLLCSSTEYLSLYVVCTYRRPPVRSVYVQTAAPCTQCVRTDGSPLYAVCTYKRQPPVRIRIYIIKQISHNESESGCVRVKTIVSLLNQRRYLDAV